RFYWPAIAGVWKPHLGGGTPRDFGPCGDVLDRNTPLLFTHFERRYAYFLPVTPAVEECLLVPFYVEGKAVGTLWAIAHDDRRKFDAEDMRQLVSLGRFASSAYRVMAFQRKTVAMNEALMLGSLRQHELTEASESLNAQLRVEMTERSRMERQIAQQSEALVDESRRKDEFLAMLSHELRNPLAPIRAAVHVLKVHAGASGSESIIQQQAREIIERQVANLTKLVSDLLEVSRVVSGRIRLDQQTVDLNQVVQYAIETAKPLIEQRRHTLTLKLSPDPVWANADATRMEEVFINLLDNAAKYTGEGGRIEVTCEHQQNHALVRVRDNGIGIDAELLPRIFDLFTQADRSLARSAGGLGIGLSLAHRIVDLHGGTLEARSPPEVGGQGSELIVKLALAPAPESVEPPAPAAGTAQKPKGARVLVVDDNIDLVAMLDSALRDMGYSVQSAYTGPDALKLAQQWRPEVVLLDIGLPGLDGYQVARQLRSDAGSAGARLIALTGYGRDTDIALAREAGFDAHLVKPFKIDELEKLMCAPSRT
ncbi:MAG: ATP-binding protein, partial [Pseudomonadota bacterium]|nr:ATP-binding protein [Pseudomonadota bacterium]